jgi:hypothetical protein
MSVVVFSAGSRGILSSKDGGSWYEKHGYNDACYEWIRFLYIVPIRFAFHMLVSLALNEYSMYALGLLS